MREGVHMFLVYTFDTRLNQDFKFKPSCSNHSRVRFLVKPVYIGINWGTKVVTLVRAQILLSELRVRIPN